jgi:hypothetical protein
MLTGRFIKDNFGTHIILFAKWFMHNIKKRREEESRRARKKGENGEQGRE